jgi:CRISPR-associated protein Csb1
MPDDIDGLLAPSGPVALVLHETLRPVAGHEAVIFPPTFADIEGGYNIDEFKLRSGNRVLMDSVGSQANRMEMAFLSEPYRHLVPQVTVTAGKKRVNLLQAAHRLADAAVRFSALSKEAAQAFAAFLDGAGDASGIARLSPMSLVFGVWDSRATQVKIPRALTPTIYADDVEVLTRSAQLVPSFDSEDLGVVEEILDKSERQRRDRSRQDRSRRGTEPGLHACATGLG